MKHYAEAWAFLVLRYSLMRLTRVNLTASGICDKFSRDATVNIERTPVKYKVVLEKEASGFSAYIPQLPGCTSQGESRREALSNLKKALKLYLWSLREDKRSLAKRKIIITDIAA